MYGAGGQKRVPELFVKDLRIPIPPLGEQRAIVRFLDAKTAQIDELIAKRQQQLQLLAEKRSAIVTVAVTRGLSPNPAMKPSGKAWIGDIPAHWSLHRLRFLVEGIEQGWSPQCYNRPAENGEWGVLKVGCVNSDHFNPDENKALPEDVDPIPALAIRPGDILVSRANTKELLGSAVLVSTKHPRLLLCDKLFRIRAKDGIDPEYLTLSLRSRVSRFQYERDATGTSGSMQNIGQDTIKDLLVPVPPKDEQLSIAIILKQDLGALDRSSHLIIKAVKQLHEYRSALITSAITGQIDVRSDELKAAAQ